MADQRLPIVNSDDGTWGTILNQYLEKEHYNTGSDNASNGMHKTITIRAGAAGAGNAPLKFTSGTNLTSAEAGAMEYDGSYLYFSPSTTRKTVAIYNDASGATGDVYYRDSGGNFVRLGVGSTGDVLTVAGGLPSWSAPTSGNEFADNVFRIKDNSDATKKLAFEVSTITASTTRTLTVPDYDATIATIAGAETLTFKDISNSNNTYRAASDTVTGAVELATTAETSTGTDATRAVTPDGLSGSVYGEKSYCIAIFESDTDVTTGDGKVAFCVPASMNGMNVVTAVATVHTAGTTGTTDIQIRRRRNTTDVDVLSTKLTIDSGETSSIDAATPLSVNTSNDDLLTGDLIFIDIDATSTTKAKGLYVTVTARTP